MGVEQSLPVQFACPGCGQTYLADLRRTTTVHWWRCDECDYQGPKPAHSPASPEALADVRRAAEEQFTHARWDRRLRGEDHA